MLQKLHWLPIQFRIEYKLAVFGFRFFEETLPKYLHDILYRYVPQRNLRSMSEKTLVVPMRNMKTFGERAFSFQVPKVWNDLPIHLKNCNTLPTFKKQLKTYLFKKAYNL